jgi:hypothetical protein
MPISNPNEAKCEKAEWVRGIGKIKTRVFPDLRTMQFSSQPSTIFIVFNVHLGWRAEGLAHPHPQLIRPSIRLYWFAHGIITNIWFCAQVVASRGWGEDWMGPLPEWPSPHHSTLSPTMCEYAC